VNAPNVKSKKGQKAYIYIPAHIKKSSKKLAAARRLSLSQLVTQLLARASGEPS
jgi:hypothetical protein